MGEFSYLSQALMCPDRVQTLYTVCCRCCSGPKNTTRAKSSDMINAAFALQVHSDPTESTGHVPKQAAFREAAVLMVHVHADL